MSSAPLRILVIGAGPAAFDLHLPVLAKLRGQGEITLALICDLDAARAQRACRRFGFHAASGDAVTALARPDIDAVYIFGSAQMHFQYGLMALDNAKHLFVEKPVAPSWQEAQLLSEAAARAGRIAVGGHNRRFYRSLEKLRTSGAGWRYGEAIFHKPGGEPPPYGARSWLGANGIHALDALVFMMGGLPGHVAANADVTTFSAVMRWPDGAQGVFLCDNKAGARREEYAFHAPGESCRITQEALVVEKRGNVSRTRHNLARDGFLAEHSAFIAAIRTGTCPPHSLASIAPSLFLAELIENGFTGPVGLPAIGAHAVASQTEKAILVAGDLARAVTPLLPCYRLVSSSDLGEAPRPEIVAAILGRGALPFTKTQLDLMPNLSAVGIAGLSFSRYEPEALLARGITLLNASAAHAESVAEMALGLAILGRRRAFQSDAAMRDGGWGERKRNGIRRGLRSRIRKALSIIPGVEAGAMALWRRAAPATDGARTAPHLLAGATVGLLGWGNNARAFAQRLQACDTRVLVWSQNASDIDIGCRVTLAEALAADIVSLHRGLTPRTRHFLGAAELERLRPGAVLINLARGALIEPQALLARLSRGDIFACLDSFETEPLPGDDPLRALPNVFLTAHIAGGSDEMHEAAADEIVRKLKALLEGADVATVEAHRIGTMT